MMGVEETEVGGGELLRNREVFWGKRKGLLNAGRKPGDYLPETRLGLTTF